MITSPCFCRGLQLTRHLLEVQYSGEETVQEVPGVCGKELPDTVGEAAS